MTISEMHEYFDLVADKFNSPYFDEGQKDMFINRATLIFIRSLVANHLESSRLRAPQPPVVLSGIENTIRTLEPLSLIVAEDVKVPASAGIIPKNQLILTMNTKYNTMSTDIMFLLAIRDSANEEVRFLRYNDHGRFQKNYFKKPSPSKKYFKVSPVGYSIVPDINDVYSVDVVRMPIPSSLTDGRAPEIPPHYRDHIVSIALEVAGVAMRDQALAYMREVK